jgi:hypothetical protein
MEISDTYVRSLIRTYTKTMRNRIDPAPPLSMEPQEDIVAISEEGMKQLLMKRAGRQAADRARFNVSPIEDLS